jgi:hypothetical protein
LAKAIEQIIAQIASDSQKKLVPCIATITNVLPSHFWNWPRNQAAIETRHVYDPILNYRNMLNKMVSHSVIPGRVYRTILVNKKNDERIGMDPEIPLWTWEHWEWEREWYFKVFCDKNHPTWRQLDDSANILEKENEFKEKPDDEIQKDHIFEFFTSRNTDSPEKYNKQINDLVTYERKIIKLPRYNICRVKQYHRKKTETAPIYDDDNKKLSAELKAEHNTTESNSLTNYIYGCFSKVVDYYKKYMHPNKNTGYTQILGCTKNEFLDLQGFCGRPDVLFLGSCPRDDYEDIWDMPMPDGGNDSNNWNWYLMLIATMSPQSETMFLTVVYDHDLIEKHWEKSRKAVLELRQRIKDDTGERHLDHYGKMPDHLAKFWEGNRG